MPLPKNLKKRFSPAKRTARNSWEPIPDNEVLKEDFFDRPAVAVARDLLGKFLVRRDEGRSVSKMIIETEAYVGPRDLASHASKGRTARTEVMFGPPGYWYVYFTYGMHWLLNAVTGPKDHPAAVLIRGLENISGPARLTKNMRIAREFYGKKISPKSGLWIEDRGIVLPKGVISRSPRIGVDYAGDWAKKPYRFFINKDSLTTTHSSNSLRSMRRSVATEKKSKKISGGG